MKNKLNSISLWDDRNNLEVLPVNCLKEFAQLHKNKFGNGSKGKCIDYRNVWITPNEFERMCGRSNWKDWKGSIFFCGRPIRVLVKDGFLKPHSPSCLCRICTNNQMNSEIIFSKTYKRDNSSKKPQIKLKKVKISNKLNNDQLYQSNSNNTGNVVILNKSNLIGAQEKSTEDCINWNSLKIVADNIIKQGQQLKLKIEEMQLKEEQQRDHILHEMEIKKMEEINAMRVEAQLHIYKILSEQRQEKEIAVQEAIAEVRAELTRNKNR